MNDNEFEDMTVWQLIVQLFQYGFKFGFKSKLNSLAFKVLTTGGDSIYGLAFDPIKWGELTRKRNLKLINTRVMNKQSRISEIGTLPGFIVDSVENEDDVLSVPRSEALSNVKIKYPDAASI